MNDIFAFTDNQSTTAASDSITDFALNGDVIRLVAADNVVGASATGGTTATNNVQVATGGKVTFAEADDTPSPKNSWHSRLIQLILPQTKLCSLNKVAIPTSSIM